MCYLEDKTILKARSIFAAPKFGHNLPCHLFYFSLLDRKTLFLEPNHHGYRSYFYPVKSNRFEWSCVFYNLPLKRKVTFVDWEAVGYQCRLVPLTGHRNFSCLPGESKKSVFIIDSASTSNAKIYREKRNLVWVYFRFLSGSLVGYSSKQL